MLVLVLTGAPPRLRGRLSTILLEVRAGVYTGHATQKLREELWALTCGNIEDGDALIVWPDQTEVCGVSFRTVGVNRRRAVEVDGLQLVDFPRLSTDEVPESIMDLAGLAEVVFPGGQCDN
ncbi:MULTISPECIES: type I-E CRISPR-associated endoribonuclease Cas2e [unclassified Variovorax]|nr:MULTISPECIES: type I-E CRISPR-associated endoribonuclease Cas2e [unclassified Variovorax]